MYDVLELLVKLAGVAQLILVVASVFIPRCLKWGEALQTPNTLVKQLFWTYAGYILLCHLFFGLVSVFASGALLEGGVLAGFLAGLMCLWWMVRMVLQFFCFDRSWIPKTAFNGVAEVLLVCMFVFLASVYALVFWRAIG
jgi:hypothetical protein